MTKSTIFLQIVGEKLKQTQCKYCSRIVKGRQLEFREPICATCYGKLKTVRKLIKVMEPLKVMYEDRFVQGTEFAIDNGLPIPEEDLKRYHEIIERRNNGDR